jgi:uncharacterized protein (DUF2342 family)
MSEYLKDPLPFPVGLWGDDAIVQKILTDWIKASAVRHIQRIPSETVQDVQAQDVQAHELHTNAIGRLEDRIGRLEGYATKLARRVEELERRFGRTSVD